MKKIIFFAIAVFAWCLPGIADDDPFADTHKSLKDQAFVVETDEESSAESLDRVSGQIDRGFTAPDQQYKSPDHYPAGPFGQEEAKDSTSQSY